MNKNKIIALIVGVIGLIVMFFFPEPETNFIYYVGFILILIFVMIFILTNKIK